MASKKKEMVNFAGVMQSSLSSIMSANNSSDAPNIGILNDTSKSMMPSGERVQRIRISQIVENERNLHIYDVNDLDALARDIVKRGVQQPLIMRQRSDGKYVIISGHRRFAANKIALEKYGYKEGETTPCIVRSDIKDSIEEREALVFDNLQRDKTDYNRMMEIIEIRDCAEERRNRGEEISNIRQYIMDRLGVSNSEIQRYLKIYESLIQDNMKLFREKTLSTNVAYEIARLDEDVQAFVFETWNEKKEDLGGQLTLPTLNIMLADYDSVLPIEHNDEQGRGESEGATKTISKLVRKKTKYTSIAEGTADITSTFQTISSALSNGLEIDDVTKKLILKKAAKVKEELDLIMEALEKYAVKSGDSQ